MFQVHCLTLTSALALASCASIPADPAARADFERTDDPAEPTNRAVFRANQAVDRNVLKPVATAYRDYVPGGARRGVHNFVSNLSEPKVLVNDILQGNVSRAWNTTQRFVVNSTLGVGGLFNVADRLGLPHHEADFGQTFGVWGGGTGPAVQVPLLGPSNVRDAVGGVLGFVADPLNYIPGGAIGTITAAGAGGGVLDGRSEVLDATNSLEKSSLDYYATLRSVSAQRRAALVQEGCDGRVQGRTRAGVETLEPGLGVTGTPGAP